jgi:hypothetical protein
MNHLNTVWRIWNKMPPFMAAESLSQQDIERIARKALKELGVSVTTVKAVPAGTHPDEYRIEYGGDRPIRVKCGRGSTAQWVRTQIFDQYLAR